MIPLTEKDGAVTFKVKAQPRAARSAVTGVYGDALKLRVAAPPVDGKANDEIKRLLARLFDVAASDVTIVSGETSQTKLIRIQTLSLERAQATLARVLCP